MYASDFASSSSIPRDSGSVFSTEWANPTWFLRVSLAADGEVTLSTSLFASFLSRLCTCDNTPFLYAALKVAENWGSFVLWGDSDIYPPFNDFDDGQLEDYVALTKELDLPNLTQLAVRYPQAAGSLNVRSDVKFHKAMHFYSSWSTPRLRSIFVRNFIPVPFSGARSLVSLRVTLLLDHITGDEDSELDVKSLVSFLLACLGLEKLKLWFTMRNAHLRVFPWQQHVEMPCVTELDLDFVDCRCAPLKIFFYAVRFPHVTAIQLRIRADEGEEKKGTRFADIFSAVLPNPEAFPQLTDMTLDARTEVSWTKRATNMYAENLPSLLDNAKAEALGPHDAFIRGRSYSGRYRLARHSNARVTGLLPNRKELVRPISEADEGTG